MNKKNQNIQLINGNPNIPNKSNNIKKLTQIKEVLQSSKKSLPDNLPYYNNIDFACTLFSYLKLNNITEFDRYKLDTFIINKLKEEPLNTLFKNITNSSSKLKTIVDTGIFYFGSKSKDHTNPIATIDITQKEAQNYINQTHILYRNAIRKLVAEYINSMYQYKTKRK